jgi:hypothetical protein
VTPRQRAELLVVARDCVAIAVDAEKRTADLSAPSHRNLIAIVHDLASAVAGLGRAVERLGQVQP